MDKPMLPEIHFSGWVPWGRRRELEGRKLPGVYVLAKRGTSPPPGPGNPLWENVVYIGETGGRLLDRWAAFAGSAFTGGKGHSGGWNYRDCFGDEGHDLLVAAMPIDLPNPLQNAYRQYVERKLILDYVLRHGRMPKCNKK